MISVVGLVAFLLVVTLALFFEFVVPLEWPTWTTLEWLFDEVWIMAVFVPVAAMVGCLIGVVAADMPPPSQTEQIESLLPPGWRLVDPLEPQVRPFVLPVMEEVPQEQIILGFDRNDHPIYGQLPLGYFNELKWFEVFAFYFALDYVQRENLDLSDYHVNQGDNPGVILGLVRSLWQSGIAVFETL